MIPLSPKTAQALEKVFPDLETRQLVADILVNECGEDVPFHQDASPEEMERVRFSVLKLSAGDLDKFDEAVKLANLDWRDLFVAAGFGYDTEGHEKWYQEMIEGRH
ncbi:MAG: hypothetical protein PVJ21_06325 [Anaerolineales bacterium]